MVIPVIIATFGTIYKGLEMGAGRVGNRRTRRDNPNNSVVKISQNFETSTGVLRRLAVIQTPVKDYQLTFV